MVSFKQGGFAQQGGLVQGGGGDQPVVPDFKAVDRRVFAQGTTVDPAVSDFWVKLNLFKSKRALIFKKGLINTTFTGGEAVMKQNIHNIERVIRVVLGLVILSLIFVGPKSLWGLVGILPILTGLIGWCPPYQLLGISTCKK